ncbi:HpcH/HpaI aldolase/citrate lyase family protein [Oceanobacillus senegalensis]|uniref:HpcH/HpaI aldolase/citrate lyase family protein n=1 Tax=Oceanobacillus senegalensis TaxID=1936063 RepID=UPI000A31166F|nr:CoA ester lyase [Oceanobacillus senegalensis]
MFKSWMFIPGNNDKHLAKTYQLKANALIFDLEDAVSDSEKGSARLKVSKIIQELKSTMNFVRINDRTTSYFLDDLYEIVKDGLTGVVLPKVETKEDIVITDYILNSLKKKYRIDKQILIVPLIETAAGLYHAYEIATASKQIHCLAFGAEDFRLDSNITTDIHGTELLYAKSKLVEVSRAAGIEAPVDSVFTNFKDEEGLREETELGKRLGFQGKLLIHPNQINTVNRIFSPSPEEIEEAKKIVQVYSESLDKGEAAIQVDGKMIDIPVAERARKILLHVDMNY